LIPFLLKNNSNGKYTTQFPSKNKSYQTNKEIIMQMNETIQHCVGCFHEAGFSSRRRKVVIDVTQPIPEIVGSH